uniref:J domain-containing protein n=1 Tax=Meloidogyne enterolobii TaxID=390850 RepID=A0A6V7W9U0_MELEN|nr:unnamed protein product [Meloidogyne enterolobii]
MNILTYLLHLFLFFELNSHIKCVKNYYEILKVEKDASNEVIKEAYKKLIMKHHPGKNLNSPDDELSKDLNNAKDTLLDKEERAKHDRELNLQNLRLKRKGGNGAETSKKHASEQGIPEFESFDFKIAVFNDKIVVHMDNQTLCTRELHIEGTIKNTVTINGNKIVIEKNKKSPQNLLKTSDVEIHLDGNYCFISKSNRKYNFEQVYEDVPSIKETIAKCQVTLQEIILGSTNYIEIYVQDEPTDLLNQPLILHLINKIHIGGKENLVMIVGN